MDSCFGPIPWLLNSHKIAYRIGRGTFEKDFTVEFLRSFWYNYVFLVFVEQKQKWKPFEWTKRNQAISEEGRLNRRKEFCPADDDAGFTTPRCEEMHKAHGEEDEVLNRLRVLQPTRRRITTASIINGRVITYYNKEGLLLKRVSPSGWWYWFYYSTKEMKWRYNTTIQQNPTDVMISHSNCFDNKAPTIKPTSVLSKIISRINYLSLARSRIDSSIGIPPHIFINWYNTRKPNRQYCI